MWQRSPYFLVVLLGPLLACGPGLSDRGSAGDGGNGGAGDGGGADAGTVACSGLRCRVVKCPGQGSTTLSGVVNIPAGNLPLYNATVYVPNGTVAPLTDGPSCNRCDEQLSGDPITSAKTDASGRFTLKDVPTGADVPLVVSLGKWRRQVRVASVAACTDTPLDPEATRLPRNRGEGHIPHIALATGGFDAIECLLRKIGLDDAEFTPEAGAGRVSLFAGHGGTDAYAPALNHGAPFTMAADAPGTSSGWWSSLDNLKKYDMLLLSCEGGQHLSEKSPAARQALQDFINAGGRAFASHWHNGWIAAGPMPLSKVATFYDFSQALEFSTVTAGIDRSFERGRAFADWLFGAGASMPRGTLQIRNARSTVKTLSSSLTQRFVYYDDPMRGMADAQYFSFNAPVGAAAGEQCGRMVFTDMHVSGNDAQRPDPKLDVSSPAAPFPQGCVTRDLSPQEKALIFLLFDLSDCVQPVLG